MSDEGRMSDEAEAEDEIVETPTVSVRVDYYNDLMEAADLGFEVMVQRRMALAKMMNSMPSYPERDASKMEKVSAVLIGDDVAVTREDVGQLWRRADAQVKRVAEALNARFAPGVPPRYKA